MTKASRKPKTDTRKVKNAHISRWMDALSRSQGHITPDAKTEVLNHMRKLGETHDVQYVYETWDMVRESTDDSKRSDWAHILKGKPTVLGKPTAQAQRKSDDTVKSQKEIDDKKRKAFSHILMGQKFKTVVEDSDGIARLIARTKRFLKEHKKGDTVKYKGVPCEVLHVHDGTHANKGDLNIRPIRLKRPQYPYTVSPDQLDKDK